MQKKITILKSRNLSFSSNNLVRNNLSLEKKK